MGIKRGAGQRVYKGRRFIEREHDRIRAGDECAIMGYWRIIERVEKAGAWTVLHYRVDRDVLMSTTRRNRNPIKIAML